MPPRRTYSLRILLSVLALLASAAVTTGAAAKPKRDPAVAHGLQVARRACAGCHSVEGDADSRQAKAPPFTSQELEHVAALEGRVEMLTRQGHYGMPAVSLTAGEIADLKAYIASLERRRAGP